MVSKPRNEWPLCSDCGRRFEFLATSQCLGCEGEDMASKSMPPPAVAVRTSTPLSTQDRNLDIHFAMTNPTNARTHGTPHATPRYNPHQIDYPDVDENDVSIHLYNPLFFGS